MFRAISFEIIKFCFSLVSFSYTFRLLMFIEAGDVTHRRRGQNRNEEFRDFSYFFSPKFLLAWHLCNKGFTYQTILSHCDAPFENFGQPILFCYRFMRRHVAVKMNYG